MKVYVVHYVEHFDEFDENIYLEVYGSYPDAVKYAESIGANWTSIEEKEVIQPK